MYDKQEKIKEVTLSKPDDIIDQVENIAKKHFNNYNIYDLNYNNLKSESYVFFRGQANKIWELIPSIGRNSSLNESKLLTKFISETGCKKSEAIAFAQHSKIATRGLDFSCSIDVALFFACFDISNNKISYETDGALYLLAYAPHKDEYITTYILNHIALMEQDEMVCLDIAKELLKCEEFKRCWKNRNKDPHICDTYMIKEVASEITAILPYGCMVVYDKDKINNNTIYEKRLLSQKGALFYNGSPFYSDEEVNKPVPSTLEAPFYSVKLHQYTSLEWLNFNLIKIIIPKEFKESIYKQINIDKTNLHLD